MGTVKTKKAAMFAGLDIQKNSSTIEFVNLGEPNVQAKIIIKRNDVYGNPYNTSSLQRWRANHDWQLILDYYMA
jgi:hypothetical protein